MNRRTQRKQQKALLRRREAKKAFLVPPIAIMPAPTTPAISTTPALSPQDEALLLELRTFGNELNARLAKIEAQFHGRALVAGLKEATAEQFTSSK